MIQYLALIICIAGGLIFTICSLMETQTKLITAVGKMAFAAFWVGLLAWLIGK